MTSWPWFEWVVLSAAVIAGVSALAYAAWVRRDVARMAAAEDASRSERDAEEASARLAERRRGVAASRRRGVAQIERRIATWDMIRAARELAALGDFDERELDLPLVREAVRRLEDAAVDNALALLRARADNDDDRAAVGRAVSMLRRGAAMADEGADR